MPRTSAVPDFSPHDPNLLFVSTDMGQRYDSHGFARRRFLGRGGGGAFFDAGLSWRNFNLRTRCTYFGFDAQNPKIVYAVASGLFRSDDSGESWTMIYRPKVTAISYAEDEAGPLYSSAAYWPQVYAAVVDPDVRGTVYISTDAGLCVTSDHGANWEKYGNAKRAMTRLYLDRASPQQARRLVGLTGEVVVFCDAGNCIDSPPAGSRMRNRWVYSMTAGNARAGGAFLVYSHIDFVLGPDSTLSGGIQVSKAFGKSWQQINSHLDDVIQGSQPSIRTLACGPTDCSTVYASLRPLWAR